MSQNFKIFFEVPTETKPGDDPLPKQEFNAGGIMSQATAYGTFYYAPEQKPLEYSKGHMERVVGDLVRIGVLKTD